MTSTYDIGEFMPESGRRIKEDGTVVNTADQVDSFYNNGIKVSGSSVTLPTSEQSPFGYGYTKGYSVTSVLLDGTVSVGVDNTQNTPWFDMSGFNNVEVFVNAAQSFDLTTSLSPDNGTTSYTGETLGSAVAAGKNYYTITKKGPRIQFSIKNDGASAMGPVVTVYAW